MPPAQPPRSSSPSFDFFVFHKRIRLKMNKTRIAKIAKALAEEDRMGVEIYAFDFDGTIAVTDYPAIHAPIPAVVAFIKKIQADPQKRWILWTCRAGMPLQMAVDWLAANGLFPDAVNENLPEALAVFDNDCRKIFAHHYIDDRNMGIAEFGQI